MPDATPPPPPADETRRDAVCAWLRANGINPAHVPRDADINIGVNPAGRYIELDLFDLAPDGKKQIDEHGENAAILTARVPLKVEPPVWWEPNVKPTRDQLLHLVEQLEKLTTQGPPGDRSAPGGYDFGWDAAMTTIRAALTSRS